MRYLFLGLLLLFACEVQEPQPPGQPPPAVEAEELTISVVKASLDSAVSSLNLGDYTVTLYLFAETSGGDTAIFKPFTLRYTSGQSIAPLEAQFISDMQAEIDLYQSRHTLYNAAAFDNTISNIQSALDGSVPE